MRRKTGWIDKIIISVFLVVFSGCGQRESPSEGKQQKSPEAKELVMWLVGSESQVRVIQGIGNDFFKVEVRFGNFAVSSIFKSLISFSILSGW